MLSRLADSLRLAKGSGEAMHAAWRAVVGSLADLPIAARPPWTSHISDDQSPFEFSLVLDAVEPEVRVLWESQAATGDLTAKTAAALQTQQRLCREAGVSAERFAAIADLFLPASPQGGFALWHAARLWPRFRPELKAYLNPQIRGRSHSATIVEEALARLGLADAWPFVQGTLRRDEELDEIRYFSLDLSDDAAARVKVYVYHHSPTSEVLARAAGASPFAEPDRVVEFFQRVTAGRAPAPGFAPATCLSFIAGPDPAPIAATLHVPVRAYVRDDAEAADRVASLAGVGPLAREDAVVLLDPAAAAMHRRAAVAVGGRALESGVGLSSYVSLRSQRGCERVTCYLSTELFAVQPPRMG